MKRTGLLAAAVLIPLSAPSWAAETIPLFDTLKHQPAQTTLTPAPRQAVSQGTATDQIIATLRNRFNLPASLTFKPLNQTEQAGRRFYRFQLAYQAIDILNHDILVTVNDQGEITGGYGRLLNHIETDIPTLSDNIPLPTTAELHALLGDSDPSTAFSDINHRRVIFIDEANRAHDALLVDVTYIRTSDQHRVNRQLILNQTGGLLQSTLGLHSMLEGEVVGGAGPSGNPNAPREDYEATGLAYSPPTTFALSQEDFGSTRLCSFAANGVITIDAGNRTEDLPTEPYTFDCTDNTTNTHRPYNHAKSPLNDVHYRGQMTTEMYRHYLGHSPYYDEPIRQYVHYGYYVGNAFFDRNLESLFYGDGHEAMYPPVELTIVAHEIAHGFTYGVGTEYKKWMSKFEAGALNESFSDMAGQAAEFYLYGSNTWQTGQETNRNGTPARYLDRPSLDGVSVEHIDDYNRGVPPHYASGLFNKVFYTLATSKMTARPTPWNTRYAFELFAKANQACWIESSLFEEAADCVAQTVPQMTSRFLSEGLRQPDNRPWTNLQLENQIRKAFLHVGIDNAMPELGVETGFKPTTRLLTVDFENLTRSYGTAVASDASGWQWLWDFGHDDATSTEFSPEHTFPAEGDYWVTLTATDPEGQSDDIRMRVSVTADYCTANGLLYSPKDAFTAALSMNGQTRTSGADGYSDYSDDPIFILQNTDPAFQLLTGDHPARQGRTRQVYFWLDADQNGKFESTERLIAQGTDGLLSGTLGFIGELDQDYRLRVITADFYVTGLPCGDIRFAEIEDYTLRWQSSAPAQLAIDAVPLVNAMQFVNATNLPQIASWVWDFGDGSDTTTATSPKHSYAQSGAYTVTARGLDNQGQEVQQWQETINVETTTLASMETEKFGQYVSVDGTDSTYPDNSIMHWDFGDGSDEKTGLQAEHLYASRGTYTITLTITNPDNPSGVVTTEDVNLAVPAFSGSVRHRTLSMAGQEYQIELTVAGTAPNDKKSNTQEFIWTLGDGRTLTTPKNRLETTYAAGSFTGSVEWRYQQAIGPDPDDWQWRSTTMPFSLILNSDEDFLYCESALTGNVDYIASVAFGDTEFNTASASGLINADSPVELSAQRQPIKIQAGTTEDDFGPTMYRAWVDADKDGKFDESEAVFNRFDTSGFGLGSGQVSGWLDLSQLSLPPGHYDRRLRIAMQYSELGPRDFGPCDSVYGNNGYFGEAEDYRVLWTVLPNTVLRAELSGDVLVVQNDTPWHDQLVWQWSFGDGQYSAEPAPEHQYQANGVYTLSAKIEDQDGHLLDQWQQEVTVERLTEPTIALSVDKRTLSYDATDSLIPYDSEVLLNFGDGQSTHSLQGRHQYKKGGQYEVTLTITNADYPQGKSNTSIVNIPKQKGGSLPPALLTVVFSLLITFRKKSN
ncbi:PKD domain-containing protein [Reinekea blandensis]|uniref:Elastase LasB n=1 Tax=Reinekea blandensis MED297 TaxID=314283 RepID=A4BAV5_9GAMM|nr:PKD domain-containing protein [Reinekea blandensis]EAR10568.1 elastase LasB [Reinekea sp. MED297] [Reinekea blandensis MED297]